jgi:hypothetical protein
MIDKYGSYNVNDENNELIRNHSYIVILPSYAPYPCGNEKGIGNFFKLYFSYYLVIL